MLIKDIEAKKVRSSHPFIKLHHTPVFVCSVSFHCSVVTGQSPRKQNTNWKSCQEEKLGFICYQLCMGLHGRQLTKSS